MYMCVCCVVGLTYIGFLAGVTVACIVKQHSILIEEGTCQNTTDAWTMIINNMIAVYHIVSCCNANVTSVPAPHLVRAPLHPTAAS